MPSKSKAQQRLMGVAYAVKKGDMQLSDVDASYKDEVKDLVDNMSLDSLKKYAATKHDGLPERVPENIQVGQINGMGPVELPADGLLGSGDVPAGQGDAEEEYKKKKKKMANFEEFIDALVRESAITEIRMSAWGDLAYTEDQVNTEHGWCGTLAHELGEDKAMFLTHQSIHELQKSHAGLTVWEALAILNSKAGRHAADAYLGGEAAASDALSALIWYFGSKSKLVKAAKEARELQFPSEK